MERLKDFLIGVMGVLFLAGAFVVSLYGPTTTWPNNDSAPSPPACAMAEVPCQATPIAAIEP